MADPCATKVVAAQQAKTGVDVQKPVYDSMAAQAATNPAMQPAFAAVKQAYEQSVASMVVAQADLAKCQAENAPKADYTLYYVVGVAVALGLLTIYLRKK